MGNNFDGLGIGFTGEDDGAIDVVDTLSTSVDDLWEGLKKVGSVVPKMGKGITRGLSRISSSSSKMVGIIGAGIGGLVEKAMSPDLDSAYASMYAGFNKEFSAMTAGMKDTEGRLDAARKKIGGIAQGMGEDMGEASKSWVAFEKQGIDLEAMLGTKGLTGTIKRLIKVTSVYGIEGEQLAGIAGSLKKGFGFTEEQIGTLADEMVYLGREFNMGKEVIQGWQGSLESANKDLADFGKAATPANIRKYMLDMAKLGVVYHESLGIQGPQAIEAAREAFSVFMAERKNIQQMARGMEGEFGPLLKGLLEVGSNSDEVFRKITEGDPVRFLEMMSKVANKAEEMGGESGVAFQRLKGVISEAMGPDATYLVTGNMDAIQQKMEEVTKGLDKSKGAFGAIAEEHWKSSITAGEAWDMMVNNMRAKVFTLSNKEIGKWQKTMKAGFKDSFQVVEAMAKDDGPLGQLTTRLLAVQRVGLSALLPGLGSIGPLFQGMVTDSLPMLTALGSMGVRFSDLGKIVGVGGAGFLFFKVMSEGPEHVIDQFTKMSDSLLKIAEEKLFKGEKYEGVRKWIGGFRNEIKDLGLFGAIKDEFKKIDWDSVWEMATGKAADVINFISGIIEKVPWGEVASKIFEGIGRAISSIGGSLLSIIFGFEFVSGREQTKLEKALSDSFSSALGALKKIAKGAAKGLWDSVFDPKSAEESLKNILKIATGTFASLMVLSTKFRGKVFNKVGSALFGSGVSGIPQGGPDVYGSGLAHLVPGLGGGEPDVSGRSKKGIIRRLYEGPGAKESKKASRSLKGMFKSAKGLGTKGVGAIKGFGGALGGLGRVVAPMALISGAMEGFNQISERSSKIAEINASKVLDYNQKMALESEATFSAVTNTIDSMFMGLPSMIGEAMGISGDEVNSFYHFMVGSIESGINTAVNLFFWLKDSVVAVFDKLSAHIERTISDVVLTFQKARIGIVEIFYKISDAIEDLFSGIADTLMKPFRWFSHKLRGWMGGFIEMVFGKEGEWGGLQTVMSKIIGEDTVKGFQKMGADAIAEQKKELMGFATWEEAENYRKEKADKERDEARKKRNKDLDNQRKDALGIWKATQEGTKKAIEGGTIDALSKSLDNTLSKTDKENKNIMESAHRAELAARSGERALSEERDKESEAADEAKKDKKKGRRGKKTNKALTPKERAEVEKVSEPIDLAKYFDEKRIKSSSGSTKKVEINLNSVLNLDGKPVAKSQNKLNLDNAEGLGL